MGVRKGWPDIFIAYPTASYHGCFIEMKSKTGRVTEEQKKIGKLLFMSGYYWVYANGWEEAAEIWENYLNG